MPADRDAMREALPVVLDRAQADLAIYLAGADPYFDDSFGRMKLTKPGLLERDRFVLESCRALNLPVAIAMADGYAKHVEDTVEIHFQTVKLAEEMMRIVK
jgi:acetoin utilization deacetylase AcuC-like enzyme